MKKVLLVGLTLALVGIVAAPKARADEWNKKTVLTFSQPVEIPGHVLPAGTYTFKLADSMSDRHIVQIFNADGSQIIATIIAIPDYRLKVTGETVIKFTEVPAGQPEAVRAWFYPGNSIGQEFVYPKRRAIELAQMIKAPVPALAVDTEDADALKTAPIVAVTPEQQEVPVASAIQTTPDSTMSDSSSMSGDDDRPYRAPERQGTAENGEHPAARPAARLRVHRHRVRPHALRQALDDLRRVTTWPGAAGSGVPRRKAGGCAVLALLSIGLLLLQAVFSGHAELVVLPVIVTDAHGHRVSGLTQENFRVLENGRPQPIAVFRYGDAPITLGLIVDRSQSMRPKTARAPDSRSQLFSTRVAQTTSCSRWR